MAVEQVIYSQVVVLHPKDFKSLKQIVNKMKINPSSKVSLQDHSVGLILTVIGLE